MTRSLRLAVAGMAVAALTVGVAAPAGAQETLGFEINITEGGPGEIVAGQVDTNDVAEHCTTDLEEFQARFQALLSDPDLFNNGAAGGALFDRFFPTGDFDYETHEQLAYGLVGFVTFGLALDPETAEGALPQSFVMTFADIATQEPVGELGNFDPNTGQGTVVVPDIEPGLWAVAAACVGPSLDIDTLEAGIRSSAPFLEDLGLPADLNELIADIGFDGLVELLEEIGPTLLAPIMVPDAFGAQIFCILDAEGLCPADEVPPLPDDLEPPGPARPVVVQPAFTG